jgi:hypothetical protein
MPLVASGLTPNGLSPPSGAAAATRDNYCELRVASFSSSKSAGHTKCISSKSEKRNPFGFGNISRQRGPRLGNPAPHPHRTPVLECFRSTPVRRSKKSTPPPRRTARRAFYFPQTDSLYLTLPNNVLVLVLGRDPPNALGSWQAPWFLVTNGPPGDSLLQQRRLRPSATQCSASATATSV